MKITKRTKDIVYKNPRDLKNIVSPKNVNIVFVSFVVYFALGKAFENMLGRKSNIKYLALDITYVGFGGRVMLRNKSANISWK